VIKARLVAKGLNVDVLAAQGLAKLGAIVQERADADAAPTCPVGLQVKPRPSASVKAPEAREASPKPETKPAKPAKNDEPVDIDMGN
jgi:hypothetical protein